MNIKFEKVEKKKQLTYGNLNTGDLFRFLPDLTENKDTDALAIRGLNCFYWITKYHRVDSCSNYNAPVVRLSHTLIIHGEEK